MLGGCKEWGTSGISTRTSTYRVRTYRIPENIDTYIDWAKDWQMEFNLSKCKVLGMGKNNENRDYMMEGAILERVTGEGSGGGNTYGR